MKIPSLDERNQLHIKLSKMISDCGLPISELDKIAGQMITPSISVQDYIDNRVSFGEITLKDGLYIPVNSASNK